jgi:hypothetical protein
MRKKIVILTILAGLSSKEFATLSLSIPSRPVGLTMAGQWAIAFEFSKTHSVEKFCYSFDHSDDEAKRCLVVILTECVGDELLVAHLGFGVDLAVPGSSVFR